MLKKENLRTQKLKKIRDQVWNLTNSSLYQYRQQNHYYPVIGQGDHYAKIIFIGEAPGKNEAETGIPFCGAAGRILDQLLESVNIKRQEVYLTNIIKDRPPANRDPSIEEIKIYSTFLIQQIKIIKPRIIATLGRFSMEFVMKLYGLENKLQKISLIHGQIFKTNSSWGKIKIIPFYHPAVALYNTNQFSVLKKDFQGLTNL
jgi:uracil-DNA glycosylase